MGIVTASALCDGVNTGAMQLSTLDSSGLGAGASAFVTSLSCPFNLQQSSLPLVDLMVVAAWNKPGYQWVRALQPNPRWAAQTTWVLDPIAGNDENVGSTNATALKTLTELARRWWGAQISSNIVWTILDNIPLTDTPFWNFQVVTPSSGNITHTITGVLGPTTGADGRIIDNTIYSGTVTGFVAAADGPNADDIQLTDSGVAGGSFTAAGLMGSGVLLQTTSGTTKYFYLLKDLGSSTARISAPQPLSANSTWSQCTLTVSQTYKAYQLKTMPMQNWGISNQGRQIHFAQQFLYDNSADLTDDIALGFAVRRVLMWLGPKSRYQIYNDFNTMHEVGIQTVLVPAGKTPTQMTGGAWRSSTAGAEIVLFGIFGHGTPVVMQGVGFQTNDASYYTIEGPLAIHDTTPPAGHGALFATSHSQIQFNNAVAGAGLSGKGNTGKLVVVNQASGLSYGFNSASPPFNAGSSSDPAPIQVDGTSYAVSALPTSNPTTLQSGTKFP